MSSPGAEKSSILLISDMAGYGKVALSAMIPVLSQLKHNVSTLPTALVSNTFDYGKFNLLDTTDYMKKTLSVWDKLGFSFDALFVGFLASRKQCELVCDYCERARANGTPVFFDPIMGDWGKLYNGITDDDVAHRRLMCATADVIVPNLTEAQYLCGSEPGNADITADEASRLVSELRELGAASIVITSARVDGACCTLVSEEANESYEAMVYDELPLQMPGTGDIFSSALMGACLGGHPLKDSVRFAMDVVSLLLECCLDAPDCLRGIPVESHLESVLTKAGQPHE